jgi:S1-C subfamily serine protease
MAGQAPIKDGTPTRTRLNISNGNFDPYGGPLLDMSGNVVGVVDAQLNALAMMQANSSLPQNVNFAIQVPIVVNFLSAKGLSPPLDTSNAPGTLMASDVAGLAKRFTVQVFCEAITPRAPATARN